MRCDPQHPLCDALYLYRMFHCTLFVMLSTCTGCSIAPSLWCSLPVQDVPLHPLCDALYLYRMFHCSLFVMLSTCTGCSIADCTPWFDRTSVYLCGSLHYRSTFIPLLVSLWNNLADSVFYGVGLVGFKSRANVFFIVLSCSFPFRLLLFFISLLSYCGAVVFGLTGCRSLSHGLALPTFFNN